jgi:hypothetical protein
MGRASQLRDVATRASRGDDTSSKSAFATVRFGGMMRDAIDRAVGSALT